MDSILQYKNELVEMLLSSNKQDIMLALKIIEDQINPPQTEEEMECWMELAILMNNTVQPIFRYECWIRFWALPQLRNRHDIYKRCYYDGNGIPSGMNRYINEGKVEEYISEWCKPF